MGGMLVENLDAKSLGVTLAALRKVAGFNQQEMAKRAGVSVSTYSRHESGREAPSMRLVAAYARELGYLLSEFLRLHEELHRSRRRVAQGTSWWRNLDQKTEVENLHALEARKALSEFEAVSSALIERFRRHLNHG